MKMAEPNNHQIKSTLSRALLERLRATAREQGRTQASIIRRALQCYLDEDDKEAGPTLEPDATAYRRARGSMPWIGKDESPEDAVKKLRGG